jgi:hypothetical protein
MSSGVAQAAYPFWSMLAILCAAMSGRMLVAAEREGVTSQAWLAAASFTLWSVLASMFFWGAV